MSRTCIRDSEFVNSVLFRKEFEDGEDAPETYSVVGPKLDWELPRSTFDNDSSVFLLFRLGPDHLIARPCMLPVANTFPSECETSYDLADQTVAELLKSIFRVERDRRTQNPEDMEEHSFCPFMRIWECLDFVSLPCGYSSISAFRKAVAVSTG